MCVCVFVCVTRWNRLDVAIVILSLIGIVLEEMKSGVIPINPTIIRVMRVLRIARGSHSAVLSILYTATTRTSLDTSVHMGNKDGSCVYCCSIEAVEDG
jgi:hypothetical protein